MFEEVRQELGAVLQQGFLETDSRDLLSLAYTSSLGVDWFAHSAGGDHVIGSGSIVGQ